MRVSTWFRSWRCFSWVISMFVLASCQCRWWCFWYLWVLLFQSLKACRASELSRRESDAVKLSFAWNCESCQVLFIQFHLPKSWCYIQSWKNVWVCPSNVTNTLMEYLSMCEFWLSSQKSCANLVFWECKKWASCKVSLIF